MGMRTRPTTCNTNSQAGEQELKNISTCQSSPTLTKRTKSSTIYTKGFFMTKVITVSQARTNIYKIMDETAQTHQPILITGKRNNVVMLSEEDWNAIEETLYLNSIPGMASSIKEAMDAPNSEFSEDIEW